MIAAAVLAQWSSRKTRWVGVVVAGRMNLNQAVSAHSGCTVVAAAVSDGRNGRCRIEERTPAGSCAAVAADIAAVAAVGGTTGTTMVEDEHEENDCEGAANVDPHVVEFAGENTENLSGPLVAL
jgi:hypothetical protein